MNTMIDQKDMYKFMEEKSNSHSKWFAGVVEYIYDKAFKHGFKHGIEYAEKNNH